MSGLDLGCRIGDVTFVLKDIVGDQGNIMGLDMDQTMIQIAKDRLTDSHYSNIRFQALDIQHWNESNKYDFVYSRLFLNELWNPSEILGKIHQALKPGGLVIIEDLDVSNFISYPPSTAFDQYINLHATLKKLRGEDAKIGSKLEGLLVYNGFRSAETQMVPPAFLTGVGKKVASLTLEYIGKELTKRDLISNEALNILQRNLKHFEQHTLSLISLPAIYQAWAVKG